ncbi:hypothetical protein Ddye_005035, partial [Dipteronia dyeriana]
KLLTKLNKNIEWEPPADLGSLGYRTRSKSGEDRCQIESIVSVEFHCNSNEIDRKNFIYIEYLLRRGKKQLEQLKCPDIVGLSSLNRDLCSLYYAGQCVGRVPAQYLRTGLVRDFPSLGFRPMRGLAGICADPSVNPTTSETIYGVHQYLRPPLMEVASEPRFSEE